MNNLISFSSRAVYQALIDIPNLNLDYEMLDCIPVRSVHKLLSLLIKQLRLNYAIASIRTEINHSFFESHLNACNTDSTIMIILVKQEINPTNLEGFLLNIEERVRYNEDWQIHSIILKKNKYFTAALYQNGSWLIKSMGQDILLTSWDMFFLKIFDLQLYPVSVIYHNKATGMLKVRRTIEAEDSRSINHLSGLNPSSCGDTEQKDLSYSEKALPKDHDK